MTLIDTHSHLYAPEFDEDREQAFQRCLEFGVETLLLPAIDSETYEALFDFCRAHHEHCHPMIGLHPTSINDHPYWRDELEMVERFLKEQPEGMQPFCAVGEIGLDFYWSEDFRKEQIEAFRHQIDLSLEAHLPIAVHTRNAWEETIEVMKDYRGRGVRGVFHAFSAPFEVYKTLREMGDFRFGIGGVVTFKKSGLDTVVKEMPLEDIVLETDCPYLTPVPFRGKRNESSYVRFVCQKIADIKGLTMEEVADKTSSTARQLFLTK